MQAMPTAKKVTVSSNKFTAVDLITVVVFAALFRVLWLVFKAAGVIFPFNHSFMHFFSAFCLVACVAVVKKRWAAFFYTVGWCAINFFLQGEHWSYWVLPITVGLIPELYMIARSKFFPEATDVYHSFKDLLVFTEIYTVIYFVWVWISLIYVFMIPIPWGLSAVAFALALVLVVPGVYLGHKVGTKIYGLIN